MGALLRPLKPRTRPDLLAVIIGMTAGPAVRAIRLYRPDPGRTSLAIGG
jgi:hypothetical protein